MLSLQVPAKINLDLRIAPPRPDGFHPLSSWFVTVGLFDELTLGTYPLPGIHFSCDDPTLAVDGRNLVVRAAGDLLLLPAAKNAGLSITLTKRIPTGGGLGGGSADAAFTLLGVNKLLGLGLSLPQLAAHAAKLGSDVAFFLHGPSALCTGRGEIVDPLPAPRPTAALLVLPQIRMPTPAVYKEFDRLALGSTLGTAAEQVQAWTAAGSLPAADLLARLVNDLEPPAYALAPELRDLHHALERQLHRTIRMSGSGSTLFTLYDDLADAQAAAARLAANETHGTHYRAVQLCPPLPPL